MQNQSFGNWVVRRPLDLQRPGSIVLVLDTRNMRHLADVAGDIKPKDFSITHLYLAYLNESAVVNRKVLLESNGGYDEASSGYVVTISGGPDGKVRNFTTNQDMINTLAGGSSSTSFSRFSLKVPINGFIKPSTEEYVITISRSCPGAWDEARCLRDRTDPAAAFVEPSTNVVVYSLWSVKQLLAVPYINGGKPRDHTFCPVQTAVAVRGRWARWGAYGPYGL
jgi:hypothetical protein